MDRLGKLAHGRRVIVRQCKEEVDRRGGVVEPQMFRWLEELASQREAVKTAIASLKVKDVFHVSLMSVNRRWSGHHTYHE